MERSVCTSYTSCATSWWQDWNEWSPCSVTCGQGFSFRKRVCAGAYCEGASQELKPCSSQVDCVQPPTSSIQVDRHLGQVEKQTNPENSNHVPVEPGFQNNYQAHRQDLNVKELCATHCNETMRVYNPTLCSTIDCSLVVTTTTTTTSTQARK